MKPERIHDAMNFIDDELIEATDKLRQAPKSSRIKPTRILALVAAALVVFTGVLVFARSISFDISSDSAANADGDDAASKGSDTLNGSADSPDKMHDDGGIDATTPNDGGPSDVSTSVKFNPESFVAGIPTPPIERFVFYHKIFPTSVYLYFYTDAHYWPDAYTSDKSTLKAYTYNPQNSVDGIGTVALSLPDNFDTTYDHATPIYANGGGGSCECEVVFRLDYGDKAIYVAFNNFAWTSDIFDFEYTGIVDEALVKSALNNAQSKAQ